MAIDVLLGLQWGDEGKGKIVDVLTPKYDVIARFQGGPNAGHTLEFNGIKHVLHTIPSGIFHQDAINIVGNGVVIDPFIFLKEIEGVRAKGAKPEKNLFISKKAHLILPSHRLLDAANEFSKGDKKIGSTLKGIGPTYTDKTARIGLRIGDILLDNFTDKYYKLKKRHLQLVDATEYNKADLLIDGFNFDDYEQEWLKAIEELKSLKLIDSEYFINDLLDQGKSILAEGAQGSLLDIDFGSYPFVTSSNTVSSGVCNGLGVSPKSIGTVRGVFKAYCTRVGSGPFPSELFDEDGEKMRDAGNEFGSTTGRPRRCGWLDLPALKYSVMINGVDSLIMTKADVLDSFENIKYCDSYKVDGEDTMQIPYDLCDSDTIVNLNSVKAWNTDITKFNSEGEFTAELNNYIKLIEDYIGVNIDIVSVGPDREATVFRTK